MYSVWNEIINHACSGTEILKDDTNIEKILFFLRVTERLTYAIGYGSVCILSN